MKLKYYLRGLGIGIIVTTIILTASNATGGKNLSDEEIIERAEALGMVMEEDSDGGSILDQMEQENTETEAGVSEEGNQPADADSQGDADASSGGQEDAASPSGETAQESQPEAGTGENQPADATAPGGGEENTSYTLVVNAGAVCRELCDELQANGVISNSEELRKFLGDNGYARDIHPGNYEIPYGSSIEEIAQILTTQPAQ